MATYTFDKIDYGGNTYVVSDSGALQLTGGQVTGPVTFGDSVSIDEATLGDLVVNGSASFTNNIQANTINGVAVGNFPKFTDTINTTGSSNLTSSKLYIIGATQQANGIQTYSNNQIYIDNDNTFHINSALAIKSMGNSYHGVLQPANGFTANRVYNLPDKAGTVALTSDIPTVPSNIVNTITTTAGAHTAITNQKGNVSFNVPTTAAHVGAAASSHAHGNITNGGDITATAPTIASGDQIIINDHSESKITNGPTFDGSTTTTALTPKGTWETFAKSDTNTTYALSGALSSHKFTSTLTAGGSGSGTSTSDFTLAAGTGITITDDTSARKMTIACSVTNTDEKVKLTSQATSGTYPLIFGPTSITSGSTYQGYYNTGITVNPSTKTVTATTFVGALTGTASGNLTSSSTLDATKLSGTIPTSCYTDTKNTAGTTNKTGTKMFLVAATEQSANPTTYSNSNCYIGTDNCLYSGGAKVLTAHQTAVTSITTTAGTHITKTSATGAVSMTIPTKTSHLTNDSGFISTAAQIIRW